MERILFLIPKSQQIVQLYSHFIISLFLRSEGGSGVSVGSWLGILLIPIKFYFILTSVKMI